MASGEQRAVCVMTDAEQYTAVVEDMAPSEAVGLINRYFAELFRAVFAHGGHVADVKGDGMLAVWTDGNADMPLRRRVCHACIDLLAASEAFNASSPGRRLPTRIGVDYGAVAFAPVGAMDRFELRAVGDTVNTSSRLEQLNKTLGTRVLVSGAFAEGMDDFLFRDLGCIVLRGKQVPVRVFELMGPAGGAGPGQRTLCREFATALHFHENGKLADATEQFGFLAQQFPQDGPTRYFLAHCLDARSQKNSASVSSFRPLTLESTVPVGAHA
jgi:adenylate cyclase